MKLKFIYGVILLLFSSTLAEAASMGIPVTTLPEPSTLIMLGIGCLAVAKLNIRKK